MLYTYQPELKSRTFPTSAELNAAGAPGLSKSRLTTFIGYRNGGLNANLQLRYYSKQQRSDDPKVVFADAPLPSALYADFGLTQTITFENRTADVFFNVNNLFNEDPRISPATTRVGIPGTGNPGVNGDDLIGRYFTIGMRFKL